MKVWYTLDGTSLDRVEVNGTEVVDLRDAVKEKWGERLACAPPELKVFAAGSDPNTGTSELQSYDPIPTDTTGQNPLIIVVAPRHQLHEAPIAYQNTATRESAGSRKRDRKEDHDGPLARRYNVFVTIRSPNGTAISRHLLNDCIVPTTAAAFWELVGFEDGSNMNGKVAVKTNDGKWQPMGGRFSVSDYEEIEGAYHFQIQRYSTPDNSPSSADEKVSVRHEELASSLRNIFSTNPFQSRIPVLHWDATITTLVDFFKDTGAVNEDLLAIATLFAMPGSGKTRSVKEAASLAGAKHTRYRIKRNDPIYSQIDDTDLTGLTEVVRGYVLKAVKQDTLPDTLSRPIIIHFDEVQIFLSFEKGEEKLRCLANVCNSIVYPGGTALTWLKFVFTGTNVNAQSPIDLGSELRTNPIPITGSFPVEFVTRLFTEYISEPTEEHLDLFERCRHNRRVTERFLRSAWDARESEANVSGYYELARDYVADSISSQLESQRVASLLACRIFRLVLHAISEGHMATVGETKLLILHADESGQDLNYVRGGGLNVYSIDTGTDEEGKKRVKVYYPEGCVIEILSTIMSRAVQPDTITSLLSFLHTSQVKTFNLGWFFEALVVYDLSCADSEFESLLDCGSRHRGILQAKVIKNQPQLWKHIPKAPKEELIWWVRDEMNSHQNRWIDVAYRQDDDAVVIIECKSGVTSQSSEAARKFFNNAINLARKHSAITWIAVYACFYDPDVKGLKGPTNLTMRTMTIDQSTFLGPVFATAKLSDDMQVEALTQNFQSQAVIVPSNDVYEGGTPGRKGK